MSTFELEVSVSISTPLFLIKALEHEMKKYVQSRQMDFVKDSLRLLVYDVQAGHCIKACHGHT